MSDLVLKLPGVFKERKCISQDLSNEFEDVYQEVPAYSVDTKTGDFLNKSNLPILKKVGVRNIQEQIDSFLDDCDIYKIIDRIVLTGDDSFLNRNIGTFGDFVDLPDNLNDLNEFVSKAFDKKIDNDIVKAAINKTLTSSDFNELIKKQVDLALANSKGSDNNE